MPPEMPWMRGLLPLGIEVRGLRTWGKVRWTLTMAAGRELSGDWLKCFPSARYGKHGPWPITAPSGSFARTMREQYRVAGSALRSYTLRPARQQNIGAEHVRAHPF